MKKLIFSCINLLIPFLIYAQVTIEFDTYHPYNYEHQVKFYNEVLLENGVVYSVRVEGTFSPWGDYNWTDPCGEPEELPIFTSPTAESVGNVGHDFRYNFGLPNASSCSDNSIFPREVNVFNLSLDGGNSWFIPELNESYNANHVYTFEIIGEGQFLMIKNLDEHSSDNYGKFVFVIEEGEVLTTETSKEILDLEIYPNPVERELKIDFYTEFQGEILIYNTSGILVRREDLKNLSTIDVSDLPSGIYFIQFIEEKTNNWAIKKIVKIDYRT